jgi:hypothetical protein
MKTVFRVALAFAAAVALALGLTTQAAAANFLTVPPTGGYDGGVANMALRLSDGIRLADRDGFAASWEVRIACPAGEPFAVAVGLDQLNSPLAPEWLRGEDRGIRVLGQAGGVCRGKEQRVVIPLVVFPTIGALAADPDDPTGALRDALIPLVADRVAEQSYIAHVGQVFGNGFSASWCYNPACASATPGLAYLTAG